MTTKTTSRTTPTTTAPRKALVMCPDGSGGYGLLRNTDPDTLKGVVETEHLQYVPVGHGVHAYCDEDGRDKDLALNVGASLVISIVRDSDTPTFVVGPVLFLGDGPDGSEGDLPDGFSEFALMLVGAEPVDDDEEKV